MLIKWTDFDYNIIYKAKRQPRPSGNKHGNKATYKDLICAFDIETTRLADIEQSIMYIWQFQVDDYATVYGRTWPEFISFLTEVKRRLRGSWLVVYIHNASYEFQFIKGIYSFDIDEVFCMDSRKVCKFTMFDAFEFRCSYIHSNMSLDVFLKKLGVEHKKLKGFDYNKLRYPWTELSQDELDYCINDVLGLVEALKKEMKADGDNLYTVPLTSTGYVRRDCKRAMKKYNCKQLRAMLPDVALYTMLREAFRGGNTHASRWLAGEILEGVYSYDRSSSYPDVMLNNKYPMKPFFIEGYADAARIKDLIFKKKKPVIMRVRFEGIRESAKMRYIGIPYLSKDKCRNIVNAEVDNGRILSADYLETTITDVDFKIILDCYTWDNMDALQIAYSSYGKLPAPLLDVVKEYYRKKTGLKGVEGQEIYYTKSKNKLNSCYGMMAQDPVKDTIDFIDEGRDVDGEYKFYVPEDIPISTLLEKNNRRAFLAYQWGVWVTAWARYALHLGIMALFDEENKDASFVYADTDSIKTLGPLNLNKLNEKLKAASVSSGAVATDPAGHVHYMGVYECETPVPYKKFCTLGAKKYCYEDEKGLHCTIAGVNKDKGPGELGSIENFKEGFVFSAAGGTEIIYNDNIYETIEREGRQLVITDNAVIRDSTYTLGLSGDYQRLLARIYEIKYADSDIIGLFKVKK